MALAFLTVLPVAGKLDFSPKDLAKSAFFFPLVGWLIGSILAGCAFLLKLVGVTSLLTAVFMVCVGVLFTRGLHLDGVADVLDGLGGSFDKDRRLAIMKDSFVGPFGVTGLVLLLAGKTAALAMILETTSVSFLSVMIAPSAARWAMGVLAYKSKYPRENGTGHPFVGKISGWSLIMSSFLVWPGIYFGWLGLVMMLAAQLPPLWLRQKAHASFGGVTGDVLGASCEFGELAGWFAGALYLGIMNSV